ncbi:Outer membrane protein [Alteromonadaceae bacterium Bs31]|nr:Outer membrane protein [Alteromonadaceae bacterium Bs31]
MLRSCFSILKPCLAFIVVYCLLPWRMAIAGDFSSQFFDPFDKRFDVSQYLAENAYGFLPVPMIITDQAVGGGLGMLGVFFHEDESSRDARLENMSKAEVDASRFLLPPSASAAFGAYTGNESWLLAGGHMGIWKGGKVRYMGGGGYGDINLDFYGTDSVALPKPITLNTAAWAILQNLKFQLGDSRVFIGPKQQYVSADVSLANLGELLPPNLPPEFQQGLENLLRYRVNTSGLGLIAEYDSRDNIFSPSEGYLYGVEYTWFDDAIGSDIEYSMAKLEGLNYWRLSKRWKMGLRLATEYADSEAFLPHFVLPFISLRGIPAARYQGKAVAVSELELTWNIDSRWSINGFAGAGRTASQWHALSDAEDRVARGAGFRYLIARRYGFRMGIDVARGPEASAWYITAGSAW